MSQSLQPPELDDPHSTTKRMRMTLACERCRTKKVKCDFAHPACSRCENAKATCSYAGSSTQIDLFNLVQLNDTIKTLQENVRSLEASMHHVQSNTQYVADEMKRSKMHPAEEDTGETTTEPLSSPPTTSYADMLFPGLKANWSLSLTPKGLRIDTNIVSLHDLYDILLSGVSQFQMKKEIRTSTSEAATVAAAAAAEVESSNSTDADVPSVSASSSSSPKNAVIVKHNPPYKSKDVMFPLYSAWEPTHRTPPHKTTALLLGKDTIHRLFDLYAQCFLCLPLPDLDTFLFQCKACTDHTPSLLVNAILSWSARHAAIYHNMFAGQDPNTVGEHYFQEAKRLLKDQFLQPAPDTVHALLLMYIYSIGKTGAQRAQAESEAYIFLGLATRMCLDLGLHRRCENENIPELEREKRRRLFAAAEFVETLCSAHSDKPMLFPADETMTVEPPAAMDHEQGERRYRTEFTVHRHRINQIYRAIHASMSAKDPLLSSISSLEQRLKDWYRNLPVYFQYDAQRNWTSTSFREQGCLKLNFEYHFQMCQLYSIFLPHPDERASAIGLLSLQLCLKAADAITSLLECWSELRQEWCHFTLDTLVMACVVYSNQLRSATPSVLTHAKSQMQRIAAVLRHAPVRHHKYVKTLLQRIERQVAAPHGAVVDKDDPASPIQTPPPSSSSASLDLSSRSPRPPSPPLQPALPPSQLTAVEPVPAMPSRALSGTNVVTHDPGLVQAMRIDTPPPSFQTPQPDMDEWDWLKNASTPSSAAIHTAFEGATSTDISIHELFRFADFVYTPIMDMDSLLASASADPTPLDPPNWPIPPRSS